MTSPLIELGVFDLETTGVDAHNDLIVTAYVGALDSNGELTREHEWTVNPGIPVPEGAAAVHGWTTERLAATPGVRTDLDAVAMEIAGTIWQLCGGSSPRRLPLAGHNISFDLTMLSAHLARQDTAMFPFGAGGGVRVLDSLVLDKQYSKYVKGAGQRKLTPTAARYGVHLTEEQAHDASFDAIAAGRICQAIIAKRIPDPTPEAIGNLHGQQVVWRAAQQRSLQQWLNTKGNEPNAICEPGWPVQ